MFCKLNYVYAAIDFDGHGSKFKGFEILFNGNFSFFFETYFFFEVIKSSSIE